jgi:type IV secretion system protein VirB6
MFFQNFWTWLNQQLSTYLTQEMIKVADALEPTLITLASVCLMGWGYMLVSGRVERPLEDTLFKLLRLMLVLGASTKLWGVNEVLIAWFVNGPSELFAALFNAADPITAIDQTWDSASTIASTLFDHSSLLGGDAFNEVWGVLIYLIAGYMCLYQMFLMALAKIAMTLVMTLSPLFLGCLLFEDTRRYFDSWIHELSNYLLISLLSGLLMALLMVFVSSFATQTNNLGPDIKTTDAMDFVLACALTILMLHQIIPMAARLSGGYALSLGPIPQQSIHLGARATQIAATVGLGMLMPNSDEVERE